MEKEKNVGIQTEICSFTNTLENNPQKSFHLLKIALFLRNTLLEKFLHN